MLNGIHFDRTGNLTRIEIAPDSFESELFEQLGCKRLEEVHLDTLTRLWIDADGLRNGQAPNTELTAFMRKHGISREGYGEGIVLGRDFEGDPASLNEDQVAQLVVTHAINMPRVLVSA